MIPRTLLILALGLCISLSQSSVNCYLTHNVGSKSEFSDELHIVIGEQGRRGDNDLAFAESQQVVAVAPGELMTAASGHGLIHKGKGHGGNFKKAGGHKDRKGFVRDKGHSNHHDRHYSEEQTKGHFGKGGKHHEGHYHKDHHFGNEKAGKVSSVGHNNGNKGHHKKAHTQKGFKNDYHKEEFGKHSKFYDDSIYKKYNGKHDHLHKHFNVNKQGHDKGGHQTDHEYHSGHGKKGFFNKGNHNNAKKGHREHYGHQNQYGHNEAYGHKRGTHGSHGHKHGHHGHHKHH